MTDQDDDEHTRRGPWRIVKAGVSRMTLSYPGCTPHTYEIEYRRTEPGAPAGYYLFGAPYYDGLRLTSNQMDTARYEAIARIALHCPLPNTPDRIAEAGA